MTRRNKLILPGVTLVFAILALALPVRSQQPAPLVGVEGGADPVFGLSVGYNFGSKSVSKARRH